MMKMTLTNNAIPSTKHQAMSTEMWSPALKIQEMEGSESSAHAEAAKTCHLALFRLCSQAMEKTA